MPSYLEKAVAEVLQKVLGTFVKGIDKDSLKLSVWSGDVRLTGLELRTEALEALPIPVRVLGASLGEVRVIVPWRNLLGKDPLIITRIAVGNIYIYMLYSGRRRNCLMSV